MIMPEMTPVLRLHTSAEKFPAAKIIFDGGNSVFHVELSWSHVVELQKWLSYISGEKDACSK